MSKRESVGRFKGTAFLFLLLNDHRELISSLKQPSLLFTLILRKNVGHSMEKILLEMDLLHRIMK